jgi:hypothetical protein
MGEWFKFVCDDCGYEAEVSGGPDAGMFVTVETMSCSGCHNLVDVVIETHAHTEDEDRLRDATGRQVKERVGSASEGWTRRRPRPLSAPD